jgi:hypothetical protein
MRFWKPVLAGLMLAPSACSYTFTIGPHESSLGGAPATCTTSRAPAVTDTVIAVAAAVAAVAASYGCEQSGPMDDDESCVRAMLLTPPAAATALIFALSAHRGFADTAACDEEQGRTARSEP